MNYYKITRTLIEILVVVVMIVLLTQLEVVRVAGWPGMSSHRTAAEVQIREIENALGLYYYHNGFYPTTIQGLEALVTKPTACPQPKNYPEGGYLKRILIDPWGNPFIYRCPGEIGLIDIISCGPDGIEGTEDDITNHTHEERV